VTAIVVILLIFLFAAGCTVWWQQLELNEARRESRRMERERDGYRDDLWRRDRLGVKPVERAKDADW
jgi:hypothetical protein